MPGTHSIEEKFWADRKEGEPRPTPWLATPEGKANRRAKKARYEQNKTQRAEDNRRRGSHK